MAVVVFADKVIMGSSSLVSERVRIVRFTTPAVREPEPLVAADSLKQGFGRRDILGLIRGVS
ncbi:hypothetical protein JCM17823_05010 [Halorubrum gandharaense]